MDHEVEASDRSALDHRSCEEVAAWARDGEPISERSRARIAAHARRSGRAEAFKVVSRILREAT